MVPSPGARVPDAARWWLAHEGIAALAWDGATGVVLAATPAALRLLGRTPDGWTPGSETIHDVCGLGYGIGGAAVADWLGAAAPVRRTLPVSGGARIALDVLTWRLPGDAETWGTVCVPVEPGGHDQAALAHLDLLYQRSPLLALVVDPTGRVSGVNRTAIERFGAARDDLVGRPLLDLVDEGDRASTSAAIARGFSEPDATTPWEARLRPRMGDILTAVLWARVVPGAPGLPALLVVAHDVTAQRQAERSLRESEARVLQLQKQEALGRLAGGIAHDFSNLLTVVLGHCDAARQALPHDSPVLEELQGIREAAQQATNLSRQLLTFSRRQVVQPHPLLVDDVVARMTPLFKRLLGPRVSFEVVCPPGLPRVLADPGQLEQVLTNVVVNARDAIADEGRVRITSSLVSASTFAAEVGTSGVPGRTYLCLSIRDSGAGMTDEVRRRAFEPFFTTKADDRGTGLGLPTVHAIVTQAGGGVAIDSAPGEGCDVRLYFPTMPQAAPAPPAVPDTRPLPGGSETILLVEDREAVRRVAQRFLARRGYRVLEAESAEQALEVAEAHGEHIDLLLSDVVLGGMDGYALALALTARFPRLRVVLMSGYPSEMLARAAGAGPVFPFVDKPIDFPTLAQLLREQLEPRG